MIIRGGKLVAASIHFSLLLPRRSQQPAEPFSFTGASGIYDGDYWACLIIFISMLHALNFLRSCYIYIPYIAYMVLSLCLYCYQTLPLLSFYNDEAHGSMPQKGSGGTTTLGRCSTLEKWLRECGRTFMWGLPPPHPLTDSDTSALSPVLTVPDTDDKPHVSNEICF